MYFTFFLQSFLTVEDMKVFSESEETAKSMEKGGVSVCIRDMTASWLGPRPQYKGGVADKLLDQVSLLVKIMNSK